MIRNIILAFFVVYLICVFQAYGAPADQSESASSDVGKEFEKAWTSVKETFEKGIEEVKPHLEKFGENTKEFFKNAADSISKETQKIIPKTD